MPLRNLQVVLNSKLGQPNIFYYINFFNGTLGKSMCKISQKYIFLVPNCIKKNACLNIQWYSVEGKFDYPSY